MHDLEAGVKWLGLVDAHDQAVRGLRQFPPITVLPRFSLEQKPKLADLSFWASRVKFASGLKLSANEKRNGSRNNWQSDFHLPSWAELAKFFQITSVPTVSALIIFGLALPSSGPEFNKQVGVPKADASVSLMTLSSENTVAEVQVAPPEQQIPSPDEIKLFLCNRIANFQTIEECGQALNNFASNTWQFITKVNDFLPHVANFVSDAGTKFREITFGADWGKFFADLNGLLEGLNRINIAQASPPLSERAAEQFSDYDVLRFCRGDTVLEEIRDNLNKKGFSGPLWMNGEINQNGATVLAYVLKQDTLDHGSIINEKNHSRWEHSVAIASTRKDLSAFNAIAGLSEFSYIRGDYEQAVIDRAKKGDRAAINELLQTWEGLDDEKVNTLLNRVRSGDLSARQQLLDAFHWVQIGDEIFFLKYIKNWDDLKY